MQEWAKVHLVNLHLHAAPSSCMISVRPAVWSSRGQAVVRAPTIIGQVVCELEPKTSVRVCQGTHVAMWAGVISSVHSCETNELQRCSPAQLVKRACYMLYRVCVSARYIDPRSVQRSPADLGLTGNQLCCHASEQWPNRPQSLA